VSIKCQCAKCGRQYLVNEKYAGKRAKCKECGGTYEIPQLVSAAVSQAAQKAPEVLDAILVDEPTEPAAASPRPVATVAKQNCPACQASCSLGTVVCVNCGYNFQLGRRMSTQVESYAPPVARPAPPPKASGGAQEHTGAGGFNRWALTFSIFAIGAPLLPLGGRQFILLSVFGDFAPFVGIPCGIVAAIMWFNRGVGVVGVGTIIASIIALVVAIYAAPSGSQSGGKAAGPAAGLVYPSKTDDQAMTARKSQLDAAAERTKAMKAEVDAMDQQLRNMEAQLRAKKMEVDRAGAFASPAMPESQGRYTQAVNEYNAMVAQGKALESQRNAKAQDYNSALLDLRSQESLYRCGVR